MRSCYAIAVLLLVTTPALAQAPQAFDPFAGTTASAYRFDLARVLFASVAAERAARDTTVANASRAAAMSSRAASSARAMLEMLAVADSAQRRLNRHYAYLTLLQNIDIRDSTAQRGMNTLSGQTQPFLNRVDSVLAVITPEQFDNFVRTEPILQRYRFAREQRLSAERDRAARNPAQANAGLFRTVNDGPVRFRNTNARIDFGTVTSPDGPLDVRSQFGDIINHRDRAVREAGYRSNYAGLATMRDTFARIITEVATARNALAASAGFADYRAQSYAERDFTVPAVHAVLESIQRAAEVNRKYERARNARIRDVFGYTDVHWWDLSAPVPGSAAPRFTLPEATSSALSAAQPLGAAYVSELRAVLDPRNGRVDLAPGPFRAARPGFAVGTVGYPSLLYVGRYTGYIGDVVILAHEAGHAAQNMMMDARGVLPRYAQGPGYFTESYAGLSELLLLDDLARKARDRNAHIYYLERLIEQGLDLFRNAYESAFEDSVFALAGRSPPLSADDLERTFNAMASRYSTSFGPGSDRTLQWVQPLQFYTWPLYRLNYVLAKLLALNYVQQLRADPQRFQRNYTSLLSRGYDAPPAELLRAELGIDIANTDALVGRATDVLNGWIDELLVLYRGL